VKPKSRNRKRKGPTRSPVRRKPPRPDGPIASRRKPGPTVAGAALQSPPTLALARRNAGLWLPPIGDMPTAGFSGPGGSCCNLDWLAGPLPALLTTPRIPEGVIAQPSAPQFRSSQTSIGPRASPCGARLRRS
jgi:hypothetical protein